MTFAFLIYISSAYASVLSEARTAVSEIQNVYKDMEKKAKDAAKTGDKQKKQCIIANGYLRKRFILVKHPFT